MVKKQAKLVWRDAAPPEGTVLSVPGEVPHRDEGIFSLRSLRLSAIMFVALLLTVGRWLKGKTK